jgi:hypothetical protein
MEEKLSTGRHRAVSVARTLHLLDVENLVGGAVTPENTAEVWTAYQDAVGVDRDDHLVVALALRRETLLAFLAIPRSAQRLAPLRRADAADHALLDAWPVDEVAARFDRAALRRPAGRAGDRRRAVRGQPVLRVPGPVPTRPAGVTDAGRVIRPAAGSPRNRRRPGAGSPGRERAGRRFGRR